MKMQADESQASQQVPAQQVLVQELPAHGQHQSDIPPESGRRWDSGGFLPGCLPRAFVGTQAAYEQICAYGAAMGWSDKPFDFVVSQWLASRPERSYRTLMSLRR